MESQSLLLALHSEDLNENCSEMEPSKVQKLELKQGTKLQLASFDSTRLKGEGLSKPAQQVEEFLLQKKS